MYRIIHTQKKKEKKRVLKRKQIRKEDRLRERNLFNFLFPSPKIKLVR